jgi:hypothetical protein
MGGFYPKSDHHIHSIYASMYKERRKQKKKKIKKVYDDSLITSCTVLKTF